MTILIGDTLEKITETSTSNSHNYPVGTRVNVVESFPDGFSVVDEDYNRFFLPTDTLKNWRIICDHTFRKYVGFTDIFHYCLRCDEKRKVTA